MVVLGEGLAAGVGDFSLTSATQPWSFAAQLARQLGAPLLIPLLQAPGLGDFPGFARLPVRIPAPLQTSVLTSLPPQPIGNLAVPDFRLHDALTLRPAQPLIRREDAKHTAANLFWGILPIAQGQPEGLTQLEYALALHPTFAIVELGYVEALDAALHSDLARLPQPEDFLEDCAQMVSRLRAAGAQVVLCNIPDPFDTAHFSGIEAASRIARVETSFLLDRYHLQPGDFLPLAGLNEIGFQIFRGALESLHPDDIISEAVAAPIRQRLREINQRIETLAIEQGALLFDLSGLFRSVRDAGCRAGNRLLTSDYLGGFYSLNGYYPGRTGQAVIANRLLRLLESAFGCQCAPIDLGAVLASDPAAACRAAQGELWRSTQLAQLPFDSNPGFGIFPGSRDDRRPFRDGSSQSSQSPAWQPLVPPAPSPRLPLQLPPGLEQILPLDPASSYFGDAISALHVPTPQQAIYGSTADFLFGGTVMVDSHLRGHIRLRFQPPQKGIAHFELSFLDGLTGADSLLAAPQCFRMAFRKNRVDDAPGLISSGDLDLATGEVLNLTVYASYSSTALQALVGVNPSFPRGAITFRNPPPSNCPPPTPEQQKIYASSWAECSQRSDGLLDFTFSGSMFIPLGPTAVWPLNFAGSGGAPATVPAAGTVMHPHLHLSTRTSLPPTAETDVRDLVPFNTVQEFTLFTHSSAFGDVFHLNAPQLGGPATGRSHLLGRLQLQFGPPTQNSVPVAIFASPPGGILAPMAASPITAAFPSALPTGPQGFNEDLRFPLRSYPLDDLSVLDDPFDLSVGALDLRTGRFLNSLLHRSFISQDLIFALLRVEPCTPQSSFFFRGPAVLVPGTRQQSVFRFQGQVHIPYPAGLKFPNPDFSTGFPVGHGSALDPYLWFHATRGEFSPDTLLEGGAARVRSSTGDIFSFRYRIGASPARVPPQFEYENHTQQGCFHLHSLAWIDFSDSDTSSGVNRPDTVTFSGFGIWSKNDLDTLQQIAVQICTSEEKHYVGIQVASGDVSNVNVRPASIDAVLP